MTLLVTVEGIYETNKGSNQKDYTEFKFDINVDRVKQTGIETHILRRFIPMEIKKHKKLPICDKVKSFLITEIKKVDDKISIEGKNIAEMTETEIQQLATLFDIYEMPLPNVMSISALREHACKLYLRDVTGLDVEDLKVQKTMSCFKETPSGEMKFDLGDDEICVDLSLLKDKNIKETKTIKQNLSDYLANLKEKFSSSQSVKIPKEPETDSSGDADDDFDLNDIIPDV